MHGSLKHGSLAQGSTIGGSTPRAGTACPVACDAAGAWQVTVDPENPGPSLTALSALLAAGIDPHRVHWAEPGRQEDLFGLSRVVAVGPGAGAAPGEPGHPAGGIQPPVAPERRPRLSLLSLPGRFPEIARLAAMHSEPERFALLHRVAARLRGDRTGADGLDATGPDPERLRLERLAREVRLEICKVEAFTRFRVLADGEARRRLAWIDPRHAVLREVAPFFAERLAGGRWAILGPRLSVEWDGLRLRYGPGAGHTALPAAHADVADAADPRNDGAWLAAYHSVFGRPRPPPAWRAGDPLRGRRPALSAGSGRAR